MSQLSISIIIPTFNRAWCIERAILSIVNQTSATWELVIVDDGSDDNTGDAIKKYLADERIHYFRKENGGVGTARNYGITKATSDFVTFLDSDDEYEQDAVAQMHEDAFFLGNNPHVSMVLYLARKKGVASYTDDRFLDASLIDYKSAVQGRWPRVETAQLCRKETFARYQFPTLAGGHESTLWNSLLKYEGPALLRTKIVRIYHTEHDARLTGVSSVIARARTMPKLYEIFLKEFEEDYKVWNPRELAYFYVEKGIFEIVDGNAGTGRSSLKKAVRFDRGKLPIVALMLCASVLPRTLFRQLAKARHKLKQLVVNFRGGGM